MGDDDLDLLHVGHYRGMTTGLRHGAGEPAPRAAIDPLWFEDYAAGHLSWKGGDPPMIRNMHMGTPPYRPQH
jgi:hypothetical protein